MGWCMGGGSVSRGTPENLDPNQRNPGTVAGRPTRGGGGGGGGGARQKNNYGKDAMLVHDQVLRQNGTGDEQKG